MEKDFDKWNEVKKNVEVKPPIFCHEREIWWCSVGINIGTEINGKPPDFLRPVLVLRVINRNMFLGVPLTTKIHNERRFFRFHIGDVENRADLVQIKLFSTKRLIRQHAVLSEDTFLLLRASFFEIIKYEIPLAGEVSEAEAGFETKSSCEEISEPEGAVNDITSAIINPLI